MCVEVYFKHEGKVAGSMAELAELVGGLDKLKIRRGYGRRAQVIGDGKSCLCPVDIEKTLATTDYVLTKWEDHWDYTARLPEWIIDRNKRATDLVRYNAAMANAQGPIP